MEELQNIIKYSKKLKLLYVEDNPSAREATLLIFEEFFEKIITAVDGEEALKKYDDSFDLIITDINMTKMNGLDMTKEIRLINQTIPILVLSAYNESGFFIDSIKLGVDGYLLKPIDMEQFLHSLNKVIVKTKLLEESSNNLNLLKQYQEVTDKSSIVSKMDLNGNITYVNDLFCKLSEYTFEELIGQNHNIVKHPNASNQIYKDLWNTIEHKKAIWQGTRRNISKSGKSYYLRSSFKPILNLNNEIIEYISIEDNITDIMNQEKQLFDLVESMKDPIVILIKIEAFDDIKKYYGNELSKNIELEFSKRFENFIPNEFNIKKLFLLENGKFAIVKENNLDEVKESNLKENVLKIQNNIAETMLEVEEIEYDISVVISLAYGIDSYENAKYGLKNLLINKQDFIIANELVIKEKKLGEENLKTLKMVKSAIEDSRIIAYFQGIIDNNTEEIVKYEALVRLINEENEILTPYKFLNTAKKGKYYSQITELMLNYAFDALKRTDKDLTINLSAIDIEKRSTQKHIFKLLKDNKNKAHRIVFELLEDEEIKDFHLITKFITKVKALGVKIAIDDFGAGYSNFERLLDYKPDILKIDGSLIKNIHKDAYSLNVVETIVSFAKKQNIKTVGEFVENKEIFDILKEIGVDYSQGFYFTKPKPL